MAVLSGVGKGRHLSLRSPNYIPFYELQAKAAIFCIHVPLSLLKLPQQERVVLPACLITARVH